MTKKEKKGKSKERSSDPFKGKFTEITAIPETTVVPNEEGTDLNTKDNSYDAHIRLEDIGNGLEIVIDVFSSKINDPNKAHVESKNFSNDNDGTREAVEFLKGYGFSYKIIPGN